MAAEKHTPLDQFKIEPLVPLEFAGYDISITNSTLWMFIAFVVIYLFTRIGMSKRAMVPGRLQSLVELSYEFIAGMVKENVGNEGKKYFPFIFTIFLLVLFSNMVGLLPYSFTPTSHIIVTFALGMLVFITLLFVGFAKHGLGFFKLFVPTGIPPIITVFLIPVEMISFLARPISLAIRLSAAMTAGHILLKVFAGFVIMIGATGGILALGSIIPFGLLVVLMGLELFVAFLQAYIFAMLASIYLHDAVHLH